VSFEPPRYKVTEKNEGLAHAWVLEYSGDFYVNKTFSRMM
jgi:hypothetical protein